MKKGLERLLANDVRTIFENIGVFAIVDTEGKYIYVSNDWKQMTRCEEDVIGVDVRTFFPETGCIDAMKTGKPIIGKPVLSAVEGSTYQYTSYFPIIKDEQVTGCAILTIFNNDAELSRFSEDISRIKQELNAYKTELRELRRTRYSIDNIIGNSPEINKVKKQIRQAASSSSNVLIEGETGTGKELVSQSIHDLSGRSLKPLIKLNCAAIPESLAESELFGYEKGAFTGAGKSGKPGRFELAKGGTLFLDEINQLSLTIQPKLLRALQEKEIERVGGVQTIPVDIRLIAASNASLWQLVKEGRFRDDLFYRLNVIDIKIPPLRERTEDIPLIIDNVIDRLNLQMGTSVYGVEKEVSERLMNYSWPGNIRELQNFLERIMNEKLTGMITWNDVRPYYDMLAIRTNDKPNTDNNITVAAAKRRTERAVIYEALAKFQGNKKKTAEHLGISRTALYNKLRKYGLE